MISKELLSEVLGIDVKKCSLLNKSTNCVNITYYPHDDFSYTNIKTENIYELTHKCKLKMFDLGYAIKIDILGVEYWNIEVENCHTGKVCYNEDFDHTEEPEAIFKACQWILENKDK